MMRSSSPFGNSDRGGRGQRDIGVDNQFTSDRLRRLENQRASQVPIEAIAGMNALDVQAALEELRASSGTIGGAVQSKTTDYTISDGDAIVFVDASAGAVAITLPAVSEVMFTVKKTDNTGNLVTISGADNIDGVGTAVIGTPLASLTIAGDGAEWWII